MATVRLLYVHDPQTNTNYPVLGFGVVESALAPQAGEAFLQGVPIVDPTTGNGQTVDSDGNARVIPGRVSSGAVTSVAANASAVQLLAARSARVSVVINNQSSSALYIGLTSGVQTLIGGGAGAIWVVSGNSGWRLPEGIGYTGTLYGIWDSADGANAVVADF